jgi:hypothetical protein
MAKAAACTSDNCPSNCTWVNNFNGFSMSDLNPMFAIKAAKAKSRPLRDASLSAPPAAS